MIINKKLLLLTVLLVNISFSQTSIKLKGIVTDSSSNQAMEFVQVDLFIQQDSIFKGRIFTGVDGFFEFDINNPSVYFLKLNAFGYDPLYFSNIKIDNAKNVLDLGKLYFTAPFVKSVDEVQVVSKKELIQNNIDKKIYNVDQDLMSRGASIADVMNNVPSVNVDQDGNISLRGDANVTILIDGRLSSLTGGNGTNLLSSISASSIERIEVISNPSSKYSPDGTSGIINIVMKKNKKAGVNTVLSSTLANGPYFNGNGMVSLRNEKFNIYASYAFLNSDGYRNYYGDLIKYYDNDSTTTLSQNRSGRDLNRTNTIRFGSDFYLKKSQTFGVNISANEGLRQRTGDLYNTFYYNINSAKVDYWKRTSIDPNQQFNMDLNVNYKKIINDNSDLVIDATQSIGKDDFQGVYEEIYYDAFENELNKKHLNQKINNNEKNNITTLQLDYTLKIPKLKGRFETGAKTILKDLNVNTNSQTRDTLTDLYVNDGVSDFEFNYKEQVYGVYATFGQEFGKISYQGGLRAEQAYQTPYLITSDIKYVNDYFKLYPSLHIKYSQKKSNEFSLSYSKRINRPTPENLNPFTNYSDPFNLRQGNPALKPEFIDSYDLGYSLNKDKISLTTSIYYRYTKDVIQRIRIYNPDNTSAVIFDNISNSYSQGFELVFVYKPFKWWRNTFSVNGSLIKYEGSSLAGTFNTNGTSWGLKYMGGGDFWKKTMTAQINVNYFAPRVVPQGTIQRRGSIDFSTEKHLNDKWDIGFRVTDILNRQGFSLNIDQSYVKQTAEYKWLTRRFYLTVSYKFGKIESSKMKVKSSSDGGGGDF